MGLAEACHTAHATGDAVRRVRPSVAELCRRQRALVTPFRRGAVAYGELRKLVEFQIKGGISGLVPVGTTGESPTVDHGEHL